MNETRTFDVIMAGGGVMGCATAYYLLLQDPSLKVAIVEMEPGYEHNSSVLSDGNTRLQFNIKENILISQYGLEKLKTFSEDMAVGNWKPAINFKQQGNLFLADESTRANAIDGVALQQELNCGVSWLEPEEIKARFPLYDVSKIAGGAFGRFDGTMDPHAVLIAYKRKSIDLGATFITGEVAAVLHADGKANGVKLKDGTELHAKYVVNSAGAWGPNLARTAGVNLPIDPIMREVFVLQTDSTPEEIYPLTVFPSGLYLIQEHGNRFMCAKSTDEDPIGFDFVWHREHFIDNLWQELVEYVPTFDRLKVVSGWAGLYDVSTFDGNAFIGEWPELKGFILANGFSGHGFQQCHAIGRYLAETIRGVDVSLDLSIFSPRRLLENKPVFEGHGKLV
ncbi:MAG TPA: FAD-binding oxidoreductase [Anaerolineales bacterium]|nr:FAD-binding oxidoreductase [Anaerolineales bacterium]HNN11953.1 FAD-binding oxidoreductase [Anaerolineales bacterium]HNO32167.1 FAD-binding oxidoreductase [Anaerolineales bacterium]